MPSCKNATRSGKAAEASGELGRLEPRALKWRVPAVFYFHQMARGVKHAAAFEHEAYALLQETV